MGNLLAPLLGGVLYEKTGYAGVFGIGLAVLGVDFIMRLLVIEKKVARRYDAAADTQHVPDLETTASRGRDSIEPGPGREAAAAVVAAAANQREGGGEEGGEEEPLLGGKKEEDPFRLSKDQSALARKVTILPCLANTRLAIAFLVAFVQAVLLGSFDATVPTAARELFGFDPLRAGLLFLPLGATDLVVGPAAGWFVDRYGVKPGAVAGYGYLAPVLVLLRLPRPGGGQDEMLLYGGLLGLCGVGLAVIGAPSLVEAGTVVQRYYEANPDFFGGQGPYAQLYGLNSMVFSLGLAVGPALAGGLKQRLGYGDMNLVLAAISLATAVLCLVWLGGKPKFLTRQRY